MKRARYLSSTPFSFRDEQASTKLAKTYPSPTPYAVKVALIIGAIRAGLDPQLYTSKVAKLKLQISPWGEGIINTHLVRHWEPLRSEDKKTGLFKADYFKQTIAYREFIYFDGGIDVFFADAEVDWLSPILPYINCFGKQGSFFSLLSLEDSRPPSYFFQVKGSDMKENATWENVSNFLGSPNKPRKNISLDVAYSIAGSSANYLHLRFSE